MSNKIILLICIITFFLFSQICYAKTSDFQNYFNIAVQGFNEKNYNKAIENLNIAIKYNPNSYRAYCLLGISYGSIGNIQKSEAVLGEAIKLCPNEWSAYTLLGDIKKAQRNYPIAIEYYSKALSLPSMSESLKKYYIQQVEQLKHEQNEWNLKNTQGNLINDNVVINLDKQKWQKVYEAGKDYNFIIEYGLKGEDVANYKWTKLVTIQYYDANFYPYTTSQYLTSQLKTLEETAYNTRNIFKNNILNQSENEIIYEWDFGNGKESELARIVKTHKGLYHFHFAQKSKITHNEKTEWLQILKNIQINE